MFYGSTSICGSGSAILRFSGLELTLQAERAADTARFLQDLGFARSATDAGRFMSSGASPVSVYLRDQVSPDQTTGYTALRATVNGDISRLLNSLESEGVDVFHQNDRAGVMLGHQIPVYFESRRAPDAKEVGPHRRPGIAGPRITKIDHISIGGTPEGLIAIRSDLRKLGFFQPEESEKREIVRGQPGKRVLAETFIDAHKNVAVLISPLQGSESNLAKFLAARERIAVAALHHGGFMVVDLPHFVDGVIGHQTSTIRFLTPDPAVSIRQENLLNQSFTGFTPEVRSLLLAQGIKADPGGRWKASQASRGAKGNYLLQLNSQALDGPPGSTFIELVERKNGDFFDQGE